MESDIANGRVDLNIDPSFLIEPKEVSIGPVDYPGKRYYPGYLNGASIDQIARYKIKSRTDLEAYGMQRHLHLHRIRKQGFINLCSNSEDITAVRDWSFRVAYQDELIHSEDEMDLDNGWPQTQTEKSVPDQELMWNTGIEERKKRETTSRMKWKDILSERGKQRRKAIRVQKSTDKHIVRQRVREEERRAQLRADRSWKDRQDDMMYIQLFDIFRYREKAKAKPKKENKRGTKRKAGENVR